MKIIHSLAASTLLIGLLPVAALADAPKTRADVKAEYAEAVRTGDLVAGEDGRKLNEVFPDRYPHPAAAAGKTRAQVKAEYADAVRSGDLLAGGEEGKKLNELFPNRYPHPVAALGKTREQVRAELAEAQRTGDIEIGEDGRTAAERYPTQYPMARAGHGADVAKLNR